MNSRRASLRACQGTLAWCNGQWIRSSIARNYFSQLFLPSCQIKMSHSGICDSAPKWFGRNVSTYQCYNATISCLTRNSTLCPCVGLLFPGRICSYIKVYIHTSSPALDGIVSEIRYT